MGYHYFWKHPYIYMLSISTTFFSCLNPSSGVVTQETWNHQVKFSLLVLLFIPQNPEIQYWSHQKFVSCGGYIPSNCENHEHPKVRKVLGIEFPSEHTSRYHSLSQECSVTKRFRTLHPFCPPLLSMFKELLIVRTSSKVLLVVARIIVHILLVISWFSMRTVRNAGHVSVGFSVRSESGISRREDFECLRACTCFGQQNQNQKDYEILNKPPGFSIRINQMLKQTNKYTLSSGQCTNCIDLDSLFSWMPNIFQITDLGASFTFPLKFTWFTMSLPEKASFFFIFEYTPKPVSGEVNAIIFTQKPSWI